MLWYYDKAINCIPKIMHACFIVSGESCDKCVEKVSPHSVWTKSQVFPISERAHFVNIVNIEIYFMELSKIKNR